MLKKILDKIAKYIVGPVRINEADMRAKRDEYRKLAKEDPGK